MWCCGLGNVSHWHPRLCCSQLSSWLGLVFWELSTSAFLRDVSQCGGPHLYSQQVGAGARALATLGNAASCRLATA